VRTYSSGMLLRLAFSVATHCDADVLIVDEALAVGDGYFQKKSVDRITAFHRRGGTLLFCSHALYYVALLCDRAIWLKNGDVAAQGGALPVVRAYEAFSRRRSGRSRGRPSRSPPRAVAEDASPLGSPTWSCTTARGTRGRTSRRGRRSPSTSPSRARIRGSRFHLRIGIDREDGVQAFAVDTRERAVGAADRSAGVPRPASRCRASDRAGRLPRLRVPRRREGAARPRRPDPAAGFSVAAPQYVVGLVKPEHAWTRPDRTRSAAPAVRARAAAVRDVLSRRTWPFAFFAPSAASYGERLARLRWRRAARSRRTSGGPASRPRGGWRRLGVGRRRGPRGDPRGRGPAGAGARSSAAARARCPPCTRSASWRRRRPRLRRGRRRRRVSGRGRGALARPARADRDGRALRGARRARALGRRIRRRLRSRRLGLAAARDRAPQSRRGGAHPRRRLRRPGALSAMPRRGERLSRGRARPRLAAAARGAATASSRATCGRRCRGWPPRAKGSTRSSRRRARASRDPVSALAAACASPRRGGARRQRAQRGHCRSRATCCSAASTRRPRALRRGHLRWFSRLSSRRRSSRRLVRAAHRERARARRSGSGRLPRTGRRVSGRRRDSLETYQWIATAVHA
jgi:hypothetical protein